MVLVLFLIRINYILLFLNNILLLTIDIHFVDYYVLIHTNILIFIHLLYHIIE